MRRRLGLVVRDDPRPSPVPSAAVGAAASVTVGGSVITGFGAAPTAAEARTVAVMECAERWAQFGPVVQSVVHDSADGLGEVAVHPPELGLYAPFQYGRRGFDLARFDARTPLEWVEVTDLVAGRRRLVPVEFIHPHATMSRAPLAAETSSGTAIAADADTATGTALCEVVERDAAMVLWHRRPLVPALPLGVLPDPLAEQLASVRRAGFVVAVARLDQDVAVPTYLVVALRGRCYRYGLGTHPDPVAALSHAVVELGAGLREGPPAESFAHLPLTQVRRPEHHRALYDDGPLHDVVRAFLDSTMAPSTERASWSGPAADGGSTAVLAALRASRLTAYACELTPPELVDTGACVVRVLVPGLVPLSFGHDRLRLGCERLAGPTGPGRLSTLLPHCFG